MWRDVELRELRIFLVLADELHFGRTAERLSISQPAVSEAVRVLESRLGVKVFDRTSRRVRLTSAGEALKRSLVPALAAVDQALASQVSPPAPRSPTTSGRSPLPLRTASQGGRRSPSRTWPMRRSPCSRRPPRRGSTTCSFPRAPRQGTRSAVPSLCRRSTRSSRWWPAGALSTPPAPPSPSSTVTTRSSSPSKICPRYRLAWSGALAGRTRASAPSTKSPVQ